MRPLQALVLGIVVGVLAVVAFSAAAGWPIGTVVTETTTATVVEERTVTYTVEETRVFEKTVTRVQHIVRLEVVDAAGRVVEVGKPPERVVSLAPSITEIVCALDACSLLVGVDAYSNYPPEVAEAVKEGRIAVVGGYFNPDLERILALDPDVVFASAAVPAHRQLEKILGSRVVFLRAGSAQTLEDIYHDIMLVATVLNLTDKGEELIKEISERITAIEKTLEEANAAQIPILVILGTPEYGVWAAGGGTFIDAVIAVAGGSNAASRLHGWVMLSPEDLAAMSVDLVIAAVMASNTTTAEKILEAWTNALAELNYSRLCVAWGPANDVLVRPGPRVADAVELVAWLLHPELVEKPDEANYVVCGG